MANVFLNGEDRDIETAIMLERAIVTDIGNAVAFTDGNRIFVNTDDKLFDILPAYDHKMLKWLLWHERMHKELRHHNRFFKYLEELDEMKTIDKFQVTKEEVNIIMDILVHDSLSKMFPELVETAENNLAQFRNRNSLSYTFTTNTLEEMLDEYRKFKHPEEGKDGEGDETEDSEGKGLPKDKDSEGKEDGEDKPKEEKKDGKKGHKEGGEKSDPSSKKDKPEDGEPEDKTGEPTPDIPTSEHTKTDWSKLEKIDSKEFISEGESDRIMRTVTELKNKKIRLGRLTETLNGLVTSTRQRTYSKPSTIKVGNGIILKGSTPGRTKLYLIFDASGSMGYELETFKEIIQKSIPQALDMPCEWFTHTYKKGKFRDILPVCATSGFDDDGDRVIDLCYKAEQLGYSPIGVTDGGGQLSWSKDKLKLLKRTVLVGQNKYWLDKVKAINPNIQTLHI